ncbi:hypothetical protein MTR67_025718 [Solanum verrucosum]|uniref:TIR domain-containing protein n=1 Tax=Solanum verrucosum TaxID=315347 RepID=A0AAF0TZH3_SOLVR|nr:hypothetical protein MTR67_025718 [Solanum verrucosum]
MASSSASSSHYSPQWKGIFTFHDDKRLEYGDSIPKELMKAIKDSKVALVVFTKNYATSRWCLDELVKIMECKDKNGQIVIPIFYDVDPSHVRNQRESFAEAFTQHELKYKDDCEGMQKVQGKRTALTAASNLKGHDIRGGKNRVMQILESCDFEAEYGLDVLIDKSPVFISETDMIEMHDLMQDMGRYVVKLQKDSGEPSRLWNAKDFNEVMVNNTGPWQWK